MGEGACSSNKKMQFLAKLAILAFVEVPVCRLASLVAEGDRAAPASSESDEADPKTDGERLNLSSEYEEEMKFGQGETRDPLTAYLDETGSRSELCQVALEILERCTSVRDAKGKLRSSPLFAFTEVQFLTTALYEVLPEILAKVFVPLATDAVPQYWQQEVRVRFMELREKHERSRVVAEHGQAAPLDSSLPSSPFLERKEEPNAPVEGLSLDAKKGTLSDATTATPPPTFDPQRALRQAKRSVLLECFRIAEATCVLLAEIGRSPKVLRMMKSNQHLYQNESEQERRALSDVMKSARVDALLGKVFAEQRPFEASLNDTMNIVVYLWQKLLPTIESSAMMSYERATEEQTKKTSGLLASGIPLINYPRLFAENFLPRSLLGAREDAKTGTGVRRDAHTALGKLRNPCVALAAAFINFTVYTRHAHYGGPVIDFITSLFKEKGDEKDTKFSDTVIANEIQGAFEKFGDAFGNAALAVHKTTVKLMQADMQDCPVEEKVKAESSADANGEVKERRESEESERIG